MKCETDLHLLQIMYVFTSGDDDSDCVGASVFSNQEVVEINPKKAVTLGRQEKKSAAVYSVEFAKLKKEKTPFTIPTLRMTK